MGSPAPARLMQESLTRVPSIVKGIQCLVRVFVVVKNSFPSVRSLGRAFPQAGERVYRNAGVLRIRGWRSRGLIHASKPSDFEKYRPLTHRVCIQPDSGGVRHHHLDDTGLDQVSVAADLDPPPGQSWPVVVPEAPGPL